MPNNEQILSIHLQDTKGKRNLENNLWVINLLCICEIEA